MRNSIDWERKILVNPLHQRRMMCMLSAILAEQQVINILQKYVLYIFIGRPKGVMMTHRNLLAGMAGLYTQWVLPPNRFIFDYSDVYFSFLSFAHVYEHLMHVRMQSSKVWVQAFAIYIGASVGVYGGDVNRLVHDIQVLKPTILSLVPRLLNKFYDHIHNEVAKKSFLAKTLFSMAKNVIFSNRTL